MLDASLSTVADLSGLLAAYITWDIDPVIFTLGPLTFRYYGLLFAGGLLIGHHLFVKQFEKANDNPDSAVTLTYWLVLAILLGSRLSHVFFYDWHRYSQDMGEILYIWKGGLSSHGAFVGCLTAIGLYAMYRRVPYFVMADRLAYTVPPAMIMVRLGNLFNSEIYGRPTDVPWAFVFKRIDDSPRHPSQLYEVGTNLIILFVIYGIERYYDSRQRERPLGLITSTLLAIYFPMRFLVEYVKEFQGGSDTPGALTMGQLLSIPFAILAWIGVWACLWGPLKDKRASKYGGGRPLGVPAPKFPGDASAAEGAKP
jgi:phosphatidylglycerol:prolipoprotein diacylglycerol transferase